MKIYDDLTAIYKDCFFTDCHAGDVLTINERDGNPKVVNVNIQVSSDLMYINSDFLHGCTTKYYKDNDGRKPEVQHDCDGIMIVKYQNTDYLVLVEMKSDYNRENIKRNIRNKKSTNKQLVRFEQQADHFVRQTKPYMLDDQKIGIGNLAIHPQYCMNPLPVFHVDANMGSTDVDIYKFLRRL